MSSLSSSLGSLKPKAKILMAPRPLRTSTTAHPTSTSSPMLGLDPCTELLEEDLFAELGSCSEGEYSGEDSAETELQMIFGGALGGGSSVAYYDSDYCPHSSLYYSDECVLTNFGLLTLDKDSRFDSFPELGASPAPEMSSSPVQGIPSRAKNPLAQEILKKKQLERVQERLQAKQESKNAAGYGASATAVHHLIASLSAVSPPPRHRSYSEPIPFGAASRTEVGSCG